MYDIYVLCILYIYIYFFWERNSSTTSEDFLELFRKNFNLCIYGHL